MAISSVAFGEISRSRICLRPLAFHTTSAASSGLEPPEALTVSVVRKRRWATLTSASNVKPPSLARLGGARTRAARTTVICSAFGGACDAKALRRNMASLPVGGSPLTPSLFAHSASSSKPISRGFRRGSKNHLSRKRTRPSPIPGFAARRFAATTLLPVFWSFPPPAPPPPSPPVRAPLPSSPVAAPPADAFTDAGSSEKATFEPRSKELFGEAATRAAFNRLSIGETALTLALAMSRARLPGLLACTESAGCEAENGAWFSCLARRFVTTKPDVRTWRAGRFFFRRTGVFFFVDGALPGDPSS
mmetsp:Transcript_4446/g.13375  ORF Transcript_4446/g.13375 Transcript_4446/m.13375 type:complete len:305 (+) Transcript_4446:311-1225(+)